MVALALDCREWTGRTVPGTRCAEYRATRARHHSSCGRSIRLAPHDHDERDQHQHRDDDAPLHREALLRAGRSLQPADQRIDVLVAGLRLRIAHVVTSNRRFHARHANSPNAIAIAKSTPTSTRMPS